MQTIMGCTLLWLLPDSWANALGNDLETAGLIIVAFILVIGFIIKAIKEKMNK